MAWQPSYFSCVQLPVTDKTRAGDIIIFSDSYLFYYYIFNFLSDGDGEGVLYSYGITSLADKREFLQKGDNITFQIAIVKSNGKRRATNIAALRKSIRAKVESIKGQVSSQLEGFL